MTSYPSPNQPYYPAYAQPTAARRPTPVTVFAILGIVFGIMGLLCKPFALLPIFLSGQMAQANPALAAMDDPTMRLMVIIGVAVGVPVSILLLAGGIGSLNLKPWARKAMLLYAVVAILLCVVNVVVQLVWAVPAMAEVQAQQQAQQPGMPNVAAFAKAGGYAGAIVEFVLRLIFPILLLYFFTRPNVVAVFEGRDPTAGAGGGGYGGGYGAGGYPGGAFPQQQPGAYYGGQPSPQVPQPPGPYTPPQT